MYNALLSSSTQLLNYRVKQRTLKFLEGNQETCDINYSKFEESINKAMDESDDEGYKNYSEVFLEGFKAHYTHERNLRISVINTLKSNLKDYECDEFVL